MSQMRGDEQTSATGVEQKSDRLMKLSELRARRDAVNVWLERHKKKSRDRPAEVRKESANQKNDQRQRRLP